MLLLRKAIRHYIFRAGCAIDSSFHTDQSELDRTLASKSMIFLYLCESGEKIRFKNLNFREAVVKALAMKPKEAVKFLSNIRGSTANKIFEIVIWNYLLK